eukprot:comp23142_c0_seq1/m.37359 comp23142_c0_seq1/g.37359  ORF comp23142_c0_seq1/g.37359 comp23142_c0_seq1/m.37359 type:complete len:322 (-) comp23142_c0_seq1:793-1758(-)
MCHQYRTPVRVQFGTKVFLFLFVGWVCFSCFQFSVFRFPFEFFFTHSQTFIAFPHSLINMAMYGQQQPQQAVQAAGGDTTFRKLFIGGLSYSTTQESLRAHFSKFGQVTEAVVITDRATGKSKGFGFVTFATNDQAAAACKDANPTIDGRKTNCNLAHLGQKTKPAGGPAMGQVTGQGMFGQAPVQQQQYGQMPGFQQQFPAGYGQQAAGQQYGQWQGFPQQGQFPFNPMFQQQQQQPQQPQQAAQPDGTGVYGQGAQQGYGYQQGYGQQQYPQQQFQQAFPQQGQQFGQQYGQFGGMQPDQQQQYAQAMPQQPQGQQFYG